MRQKEANDIDYRIANMYNSTAKIEYDEQFKLFSKGADLRDALWLGVHLFFLCNFPWLSYCWDIRSNLLR